MKGADIRPCGYATMNFDLATDLLSDEEYEFAINEAGVIRLR
jgi:hypothetical protein